MKGSYSIPIPTDLGVWYAPDTCPFRRLGKFLKAITSLLSKDGLEYKARILKRDGGLYLKIEASGTVKNRNNYTSSPKIPYRKIDAPPNWEKCREMVDSLQWDLNHVPMTEWTEPERVAEVGEDGITRCEWIGGGDVPRSFSDIKADFEHLTMELEYWREMERLSLSPGVRALLEKESGTDTNKRELSHEPTKRNRSKVRGAKRTNRSSDRETS